MSMITATTWVPRGFAAPFPTKYVFDEGEYERIAQLAKLQLDDAKEELEEAKEDKKSKGKSSGVSGGSSKEKDTEEIDDDLKEYDLEHYDDDDEGGDTMAMFGNVKNLIYHDGNDEDDDGYIAMDGPDAQEEEDEEEREELQILATDNLVLAGRIEDEVAHLEVYVYEDEADNLYVHHDIMLPAIPLAVEWLDVPVGKTSGDSDARGNFVAVGTMDPDIEIWNLDVVDSMYPDAVLGQGAEDAEDAEKKKKKKKKSKKVNDNFHVDAVLSLASNRHHRNLLASASADQTIKLWDLNTTKCAKSYAYHTDKVSSVAWNPVESTVLLSGSYDRTVVAADMRAPDAKAPRWGVESDIEAIRWDPHDSNYFYVSTENGIIHYHDARNAPSTPSSTKPVWILQAHDESISSFDINPVIPGFIATGSTDKQTKLWNVQASGPSMVVSRDLGVGKVFSTTFAPDKEVGFRLAVAGSKGAVQIWDTSTNAAVRAAFASKVPKMKEGAKERLVGLEEEDTDSDSEEGEEDEEEAARDHDGWESMEE
ncbi:periodic tryptophan protein-like protein [Aaosphaeria arxii CBS 175.79]|uniref:Periodic tryptophan protein-like protein n=1 Tax=Aaosphaeria arxii CBS 175.79 TaxID=1450172 RepID=A0A6A5XJA5_9PLEO|nr:periodic tryptophan protein-like protein [Aaosphaeria arxii CBS 175.79]KAF2013212.1 periodic tryptophan protein-like protein [Aaosphaeria arxii CBS 175.79]